MVRAVLAASVAAAGVALAAGTASAQMTQSQSQTKFIDEMKFGVLAHDPGFLGGKESGADINAEVLFTSPSFLKILLAPRPHIGGSVNTNGQTNQAYAGLTWTWALFRQLAKPDDALLFGFSFGPGYNDGKTFTRDPHRKSLGWQVMFRESFELGYQLTPRTDVSAFLDHISNGGIARANQSINDVGMRVGYKF